MSEADAGTVHPPGRNFVLYIDGSSGSGDRATRAGIGIVLRDPEGNLLDQLSLAIGPATRRVAAYQALIQGLHLASRHDISRLRVFADTEILVDEITRISQVTRDEVRPWHAEALDLFESFPDRRIYWVPRKWNEEARGLSAEAAADPQADG